MHQTPEGVELAVLVSAGSAKQGLRGVHGDALKIAVRAAPERGKANAEVESVLAGLLGIAPKRVQVASGATSRRKKVLVVGATPAEVGRALGVA